eukprot:1137176-Pelagomonas_calceolata.AAC.3
MSVLTPRLITCLPVCMVRSCLTQIPSASRGCSLINTFICTMLLRKLSNPAWQVWLACVLLPVNTRLHTAYMPTYGSSRRMAYQQECMQVRSKPLHIFKGTEMGNCIQKWLLRLLKSMLGVRTSTPSWSVIRECGIEPIQSNLFRACARFYNSLTRCNSTLLHNVFHADTSLRPRNSSCWTFHLLP